MRTVIRLPVHAVTLPDPSISIVIPVYNDRRFVADALDSALGQTHENVEVIAVDDCSNDGTVPILERYGDRITLLKHCARRGSAAARNSGIRAAGGEYVMFLDSDDMLSPDAADKTAEAIKRVDSSGGGKAPCSFRAAGTSTRTVARSWCSREILETG